MAGGSRRAGQCDGRLWRMLVAGGDYAAVGVKPLAMFVPTGWAMDASHKLMNFGGDSAHRSDVRGLVFAGAVVARKFRFE